MKVLLDPGHGGKDCGALNGSLGIKESMMGLAYARALRTPLVRAGHDIRLTRDEDVSLELATRCAIANAWHPDLFLSLHCNAAAEPTAHGIEVWTSPGRTPADGAASAIYNAIQTEFPERLYRMDKSDGDPDKESRFYVLVHTQAPAVLLELGFLSNDMEAEWLDDDDTIFRYARAIAAGIEAWRTSG